MRDRTWLIAVAAALWGFSGLLRAPLVQEYAATSIVLWEHLVLVLLTAPLWGSSVRALRAASLRTRLAVVVIGVGSSALATVMFTLAFRYGDPVTPQVLQKLQPLIAVALAALILKERPTGRFALFIFPALAGALLLAFANPFSVSLHGMTPALLGLGAAALWAAGTVLGRGVSSELTFWQVTTLRFMGGFLALIVVNLALGTPIVMPVDTWGSLLSLAVVPGLLALMLYYFGLQRTPASRATVAELAFPVTAAVVGVTLMGASLTLSQWLGAALVVGTVVALSVHERTAARAAVPDALVRGLR